MNRVCTERDEARREAYRQWLMRQCELEADRGTNVELRRLSKIYRDNFGGEYGDDSDNNRDLPPYELHQPPSSQGNSKLTDPPQTTGKDGMMA